MTSEKQRRAGYILPAQLTGHPLVCLSLQIPDVAEYRAAVRGALNELGKWWAWEKSGYGDTRATQAATYWRALLEDLQIGECGAATMFDVRQNEEAPCTLEKTADGETWEPWANLQLCPPKIKAVAGRLFLSTDGGATWDPVQDTTYEEYDWRQDEPLRPARTGDNKRCLAAANAVAVFVELHREIVAWYESQGTLLQIGMAISAAIAIMFPVGWPVVAGGLLTGAGAAVLQWSQALTNTAFTQTIQDQLQCIFYTYTDADGRWSQAAFNAVLADVDAKTGDMWELLAIYLSEIGGYTGLNNAGTTTTVATANCATCEEATCYYLGTEAQGTPFLVPHIPWYVGTPGRVIRDANGLGQNFACNDDVGALYSLAEIIPAGPNGWEIALNFSGHIRPLYASVVTRDTLPAVEQRFTPTSGETFTVPANEPYLVLFWAGCAGRWQVMCIRPT